MQVLGWTCLLTCVYAETAYPSYCSKVDSNLPALRSIPQLTFEAKTLTSEIVQVQVIVRHGARAPANRYNCWSNYEPEWNCGLEQIVQGRMTPQTAKPSRQAEQRGAGSLVVNDSPYINSNSNNHLNGFPSQTNWLSKVFDYLKSSSDTNEFAYTRYYEKSYDADARQNVLGGTCQKGQLLAEGFQQHQLIGHLLASAYQLTDGRDRVPFPHSPPLVSGNDYKSEIFFRASDMQRTLLSGSALLTSYLQSITHGSSKGQPIHVHTMDLEREYIFPNLGACAGLRKVREDIFASSGYADLRDKYSDLEEKIKLAVGRDDISDVWPGEFFDCLMTTLCTDQAAQLPAGLRPEIVITQRTTSGEVEELSLLNHTFAAVDDYATYEYTWNESLFSKTAMAKLVTEVKAELIRALARDISENLSADVDEFISNITGTSQYQEFANLIATHTRFNVDDTSNPWDAKKLVVYAGHDTTIMPFLAAFEGTVFNKKWPPYASEVVVELHRGLKTGEYFFRLIYNGDILTADIPGCMDPNDGATDLCRIASFFAATAWATPNGARSLCMGPGVSSSVPATERWLLRRRIPERQITG